MHYRRVGVLYKGINNCNKETIMAKTKELTRGQKAWATRKKNAAKAKRAATMKKSASAAKRSASKTAKVA